ncbi:DUF2628 domain-containing protein [Pseudomonas sp. KNUC1026]|uniref:DUF2628 domain-containing protein n=1 Tax=Pseudomonas sp. KNUC1026 TaxID=2893890 RepID=UPI001F167736|nr:DUF2628 domain-containing protein [Pseudomonas sp. KNUC1026]UFH50456.1 DUF2628 domain-containing protein [Pseudomonas sp. KNUC1026]
MSSTQQPLASTGSLNEKWKERFAFFEAHGEPKSAEYQAALKALPRNKQRLIQMNIIAFFFGIIYLFVLGMWRKNLSFIGIFVAIGVVEVIIEATFNITIAQALQMGISVAMAMMYALSTNYSYYLTRVKGSKSWNPFEGMRWI